VKTRFSCLPEKENKQILTNCYTISLLAWFCFTVIFEYDTIGQSMCVWHVRGSNPLTISIGSTC